ncbi:hypothetical protein H6F67_16290 [Microcoleus sp. FACHB-1515]|uniref:hypothetical protein n=1 Tax=Cyanophyceae TaxID=3028117 RepID=UPI001688EA5C|nr:hypothetical protein [Microcoleus sp. FACHB-1515]MBD2091404.1 hypothetical protein [Microcoleus sp. FACHB-1515]
MTPYDQFKQRVKDLTSQQGCFVDQAIETALGEYSQLASLNQTVKGLRQQGCSLKAALEALQGYENLADQADKLLKIKQEVEWEMRFGQ